MLALKEAAHRSGNHDYKPYFDVLFKDVEETEKQTAMKLLNEKFQFKRNGKKDLKPKNLKPKNLKPKEKKAKCLLIRTKLMELVVHVNTRKIFAIKRVLRNPTNVKR